MKKEKIFSKFNIRNYNDELEEVIESKPFSENVKNNILNMIYKIEESYDDYEFAKVDVPTKKEFLEKILKSLKDYCNLIEISNSNEIKEKKFKINYEKGSIKVVPNHTWMLYAILGILKKEKSYHYEKDMLQTKPVYDFLSLGYNINSVEVIRDFNGWSWVTSSDEMQNVYANLVYQNIQYLLGNKYMEKLICNSITEENDFVEVLFSKLAKKYGENVSTKIINLLRKISIIEIAKIDENYRKILLEIKQRKQEELKLMENKKEYLKEITYIKKTNIEIIKGIDRTINNKELLQVEYRLRNSMLKNDEKIFSISYLVDILNNERKEALDKIAEINTLMEPRTYVRKKEEIKNIIDEISADEEERDNIIVELQRLFISCLLKDIKQANEKIAIMNNLYKVRYYINILSGEENKYIKDIIEIESEISELKEKIIKKMINNKLVFEFSENSKITEHILRRILETKIINIESIYIILRKDNDKIKIETYDEDELVKVEDFDIQDSKYENIKLDKKTKLFI